MSVLCAILVTSCIDKNPPHRSIPKNGGLGLVYDMASLYKMYEIQSNKWIDTLYTKVVQLELNDQSLIHDIIKVEQYKSSLIVLSRGRNEDILVFDSDTGHFKYSLKDLFGHTLLRPTDFDIHNGLLYVMAYDLKMIMCFDNFLEKAKLVATYETPIRFTKFVKINEERTLIHPGGAALNKLGDKYLNYNLILLDKEYNFVKGFLPYDIDMFHYGNNYQSTNSFGFVNPFYQLKNGDVIFSDLLRDTSYIFQSKIDELNIFSFHKDNSLAMEISEQKDLEEISILIENSNRYLGNGILYADKNCFVFTSVLNKKIATIRFDRQNRKYDLINYIDFNEEPGIERYPLGFPINFVSSEGTFFSIIHPFRLSGESLRYMNMKIDDNPAIVKYRLKDIPKLVN